MEINKSEAKELDYVELWIGTTITRQGGLVSGQELLSQSKVALLKSNSTLLWLLSSADNKPWFGAVKVEPKKGGEQNNCE